MKCKKGHSILATAKELFSLVIIMDVLLVHLLCFMSLSRMSGAGGLTVRGNVRLPPYIGGKSELTCTFSSSTNPSFNSWIFLARNEIGSCTETGCTAHLSRHQISVYLTDMEAKITFTINDTQFSDFGTYWCKVSTILDTQSVLMDLELIECPMQVPTITCSSSLTIDSHTPLTLQCSDQVGLHENGFIHHQSQYDIIHSVESSALLLLRTETYMNNSSLLTESVNLPRGSIPNAMEDQGLQITTRCCRNESILPCLATDLCSSFCNTTVFYPPTDLVLTQSPTGPWREGWQNASMACRSNGFPPPHAFWRKVQDGNSPGIILANGTGSSRLSFTELHRVQSGVYRCESHDHLGRSAAETINVSVQYPPHIDRQISSVHANEGRVATLPCVVDANPSTMSMITWYDKNKSHIVSGSPFTINFINPDGKPDGSESRLSFTVDRASFGNYSCTAKNSLGSDSFIIQVSGYSYPDTPYDLQVVSHSETSLTLSWAAGQDGGLPVTYAITYCVNVSKVERACKTKQSIVTTEVVVTELRSYTLYSITLLAVNGVGNSKTGADITTSTAPGTPAVYGIRAIYEMGSGILELSPAELLPLPRDLCIYAEFHVGGFRHRNETCLRPGQIGHIQNGARENQLWLVICGKGVCSSRSAVTYTDGETDLRRLMVIVIPVSSCFGVCILLILTIACIRRLIRRRRRAYDLDTEPGKSPVERPSRLLPPQPTQRHGVGSEHTTAEFKETIVEGYEMMEIKCADKLPPVPYLLPSTVPPTTSRHPQRPPSGDDRVLSSSEQGYIPMDNTGVEGIYMTHLRNGPSPEVEDGSTSGSGAPDLETFPGTKKSRSLSDESDDDVDDGDDLDSLYDTYTFGDGEYALQHEYLKASGSQGSMFLETAL